jgi:sugar/nucleoside kinase (ribokinase family)
MATVLACGVAVLDVQQTVDRLPGPDEKLVANDLLVSSGGPAANAAVIAAALGVDVRLVTRMGTSPLGTLISADLAGHGVEVLDRAGPLDQPAVSTVLVTRGTGQRAVVSVSASRQGPASPVGGPATARWASELVDGVDAVLVDGHHLDLALALAAAARVAGVPVLLDGGSWKPGLERLLAVVDIALVSEVLHVPAELGGSNGSGDDVLAAIRALGPTFVARSRGPLPIDVLTMAGRAEIPVPHVEVVDTLGAGDVLHGALAAWLAVRGTGDVLHGLAWSARIAADSCTGAGARGWLADTHRLANHRASLAPGRPSGSPSS